MCDGKLAHLCRVVVPPFWVLRVTSWRQVMLTAASAFAPPTATSMFQTSCSMSGYNDCVFMARTHKHTRVCVLRAYTFALGVALFRFVLVSYVSVVFRRRLTTLHKPPGSLRRVAKVLTVAVFCVGLAVFHWTLEHIRIAEGSGRTLNPWLHD